MFENCKVFSLISMITIVYPTEKNSMKKKSLRLIGMPWHLKQQPGLETHKAHQQYYIYSRYQNHWWIERFRKLKTIRCTRIPIFNSRFLCSYALESNTNLLFGSSKPSLVYLGSHWVPLSPTESHWVPESPIRLSKFDDSLKLLLYFLVQDFYPWNFFDVWNWVNMSRSLNCDWLLLFLFPAFEREVLITLFSFERTS